MRKIWFEDFALGIFVKVFVTPDLFDYLVDHGVNFFGIEPKLYMEERTSNTVNIVPPHNADPSVWIYNISDEDILYFLRQAALHDLRVMIKPFLTGKQWKFYAPKINPSNPEQWFDSYGDALVHYAELTNQVDNPDIILLSLIHI